MTHDRDASTASTVRTAIVVGTGAIGMAVIDLFTHEGTAVVAWDCVRATDAVPVITVNITDAGLVDAALAASIELLGHIDTLVVTAGVASIGGFVDIELSEWQRVIDVNLTGAFIVCQSVARTMARRGSGSIINVSSVSGLRGERQLAHYSASKFGLIGMTQSMALDLAPFGVRANCVAPGAVDSPMNDLVLRRDPATIGTPIEALRDGLAARTPLGRLCTARDVAETIAFLASDRAAFITGETVPVRGGLA